MRIILLIFCLFFSYCGAENMDASIRGDKQNLDLEKWEVYFQECFSDNQKSCQLIIDDGLKDAQSCNAKKQCSLIGEIYWRAENFEESLQFFQKACEKKDQNGCYYIALKYEKEENYTEAKKYYEGACEKKNMSSCFKMGTFYDYGLGVRQDYPKASEFYKKACKNKQPESCYNIAVLYYNGDGLVHDLSMAKEFYGQACDLGLQAGCDRYKELNQSGIPSLYSKKNIF